MFQRLLVLAYNFENPNNNNNKKINLLFSIEKASVNVCTWKYTTQYILMHAWKRRGKKGAFGWSIATQWILKQF